MERKGRRAVLILLVIAVVGGAWYLQSRDVLSPAAFVAMAGRHPLLTIAAFLGIYCISVLACLPTLPLNLAAGVFWGVLMGGVLAAAGSSVGALAAFLAARSICGRPLARKFDHQFVARLQEGFDTKGWKYMAFLRLTPAIPTGPLNYVLGLTSISTGTYAWTTPVFILPPSIAMAAIGHGVGSFLNTGETVRMVRGLLAISAAVAVLIATPYALRYLNRTRTNENHCSGADPQRS